MNTMEKPFQATMLQHNGQNGRKGERSQRGLQTFVREKQIWDLKEYEFPSWNICAHPISPLWLGFLMCNGGRKQKVQKEFSETHKQEQWEALAKEQNLI